MEHTTFLPEATSGQQRYAYHRWNILFEAHTGLVFLLLWAVYAAMTFVQQEFIFTDAVYYNSLGEQLTHERIEILLELRSRWGWISYFFIPVTILFQAFFVTICLNIGTLLSENPIYRAVTFKSLFGLVLKSSVVHVAYPLLLLLFAFSMQEIEVMEDYQRLDYFSLAAWLGLQDINEWWVVPLRAVQVFELLFWMILAGGLSVLFQESFRKSLGFVAATYGVGLFLWLLFIMFLQLNFTA